VGRGGGGEKKLNLPTQKKNEFPLIWAQFPWSDRWFHKNGVFLSF